MISTHRRSAIVILDVVIADIVVIVATIHHHSGSSTRLNAAFRNDRRWQIHGRGIARRKRRHASHITHTESTPCR